MRRFHMGRDDVDRMRARAKALERRVEEAKKDLAKRAVEGSSAGGLVRACASGDQTLLSIEIAPQAIDAARAAELCAMVIEAVNQALARSKELTRSVLDEAAGGVPIPGL